MDKIDLDAIIDDWMGDGTVFTSGDVKGCMRYAIGRALVLASEKAKATNPVFNGMIYGPEVDKQSILDVEKLIQ